MSGYLDFRYTLKNVSKLCTRNERVLYTPYKKFKLPNCHRVQGGLRTGNGEIRGALILFPDCDDKHLVWPAELQYKLLASLNGRTELLGTEKIQLNFQDVEEFSENIQWKSHIMCSLTLLKEKGMVDHDDSVTFIWAVQLCCQQPQAKRKPIDANHVSHHKPATKNVASTDSCKVSLAQGCPSLPTIPQLPEVYVSSEVLQQQEDCGQSFNRPSRVRRSLSLSSLMSRLKVKRGRGADLSSAGPLDTDSDAALFSRNPIKVQLQTKQSSISKDIVNKLSAENKLSPYKISGKLPKLFHHLFLHGRKYGQNLAQTFGLDLSSLDLVRSLT